MSENALPSIFTIEVGGTPTLTFEAQNLREAHELCHEEWLKGDLIEAKSDGVPLWDGKAKLRARIALPDERALLRQKGCRCPTEFRYKERHGRQYVRYYAR
jgi:hypothetical protein